jgi:quinoprotein dehydrogenase-associated probable ABC transporter substrate-binding protein
MGDFLVWSSRKPPRVVSTTITLMLMLLSTSLAQEQSKSWEMRVCADPNSLPFSHEDKTGYENRIAEILAEELGARLTYVWWYQGPNMISDQLREGGCDLIMGVPDGHRGLLTTLAYYRSSYMFVYRADSPFDVGSLDDPVLHDLEIGVQRTTSSPHQALLKRNLAANVTLQQGRYGELGFVVDAVAAKEVDLGIIWGPVAGYYAQQQPVELQIVPVTPELELPFLSMVLSMTIGIRQGDEALRDRLDAALVSRWEEVQGVLHEYGVPLSPLPKPLLQLGAQ